ncbi:tetratricopeptide repeat protein [Permianibacter aggregans]|uniref:Tetratricopeptide repeat protein n=1 Tax=Permianibacter aggregans TaxID=1510150 RepID=A0A4R6UXS7_9GAMM|nr:tetratricopeptide repeat protein [Permianibacter aggregans]TDQ48414.1 tetratricopeptide repeat protein [Permianibacter aggregans]
MEKIVRDELRTAILKAMEENRYLDVLEGLSTLQASYPEFCERNFQFYLLQGDALFATQRFDEAAENYRKVQELEPDNLGICLNLIKTDIGLEQYASASEQIQKALTLATEQDPELMKYLYIQQAEMAYRLQKMDEVYTALELAAQHGAMDIDVMDSEFLYNALFDDDRFNEMFERSSQASARYG